MQASTARILTLALAAAVVLGTFDFASARHKKKHRVKPAVTSTQPHVPGSLVPLDREGTPIIMRGYRSPSMMRDAGESKSGTKQHADRPVKIPRGSSTYIPPPNPSPSGGPPAAALTQPAPAPYQPPKLNTFGDRVTNCTHSYPLNAGIGNNPTDQQSYIRQCAN